MGQLIHPVRVESQDSHCHVHITLDLNINVAEGEVAKKKAAEEPDFVLPDFKAGKKVQFGKEE